MSGRPFNRTMENLGKHQVAYFHILVSKRHHYLLCSRWRGQIYQFRTFHFSLSTAAKTFVTVIIPVLLQHQKVSLILFLYLVNGKDLGRHGGLFSYMWRSDKVTGPGKLYQHGRTTGKIALLHPAVFGSGRLTGLQLIYSRG